MTGQKPDHLKYQHHIFCNTLHWCADIFIETVSYTVEQQTHFEFCSRFLPVESQLFFSVLSPSARWAMLGLCKYITWGGWSRSSPMWKCCEITFVVEWWYEIKDGWLVGLKYECGSDVMGRKATQLSEQMLAKLISAKLQIRSKCMFFSVVTLRLFGFSVDFFSSQRCAYAPVWFRHKNHLVRIRKTSCSGKQDCFCHHKHDWKVSR